MSDPNGQPADSGGFDTPPTAAEAQQSAPAAAPIDFDSLPDAPSLEGVSPESLQRRDAGIALDSPPRARPEPAPSVNTDLLAWQITNSPYTQEQAIEAIDLSKRTGMSPQFVADNLDDIRKRVGLEDLRATMRSSPAWSMERPTYKEGRSGIPGMGLLPQPVADLLYGTGLSSRAFSGGGAGGGPQDPSSSSGSLSPYRLAEQTIARAANAFVQQTGKEPGAPEWEHWVKEMVRPGYVVGRYAMGGWSIGDSPELPWAVAKSQYPDKTFIPKPDPGYLNVKDSAGRFATNVAAPPAGHVTMMDPAGEAWTVLEADGSSARALRMGWRKTEVVPYRPGSFGRVADELIGVVNAIGGPTEGLVRNVVTEAAKSLVKR